MFFRGSPTDRAEVHGLVGDGVCYCGEDWPCALSDGAIAAAAMNGFTIWVVVDGAYDEREGTRYFATRELAEAACANHMKDTFRSVVGWAGEFDDLISEETVRTS